MLILGWVTVGEFWYGMYVTQNLFLSPDSINTIFVSLMADGSDGSQMKTETLFDLVRYLDK